jgi:hypothetical protein
MKKDGKLLFAGNELLFAVYRKTTPAKRAGIVFKKGTNLYFSIIFRVMVSSPLSITRM